MDTIAVGKDARGVANPSSGLNALFSNTTGDFNTANGGDALFSNTTIDIPPVRRYCSGQKKKWFKIPIQFDVICRFIPYWLVRRARFVGEVIAYANGAGALAWMARRTLRTRLPRMAFAVTVFCAGLVVFRVSINDYFIDRMDQRRALEDARDLQEAVRDLPVRALVAADDTRGAWCSPRYIWQRSWRQSCSTPIPQMAAS
jgi:hypothetical protein